ncbi:D-2-hydroxyacid dehydrogenase [Phytohalomonas tamaricis]|uniref:D-2-hydroxyacid dehydrogenase n=1 Tax=Phytohalomonas tamaricis TaxID=2081032 RepID=UPI000D0B9D3F|nr:D-2-hydroxyacid dehydrogenase [Phytohalomonas tamaricis]
MKAVLLDAATLSDDVDLGPIAAQVEQFEQFELTDQSAVIDRLKHADIALTNKVIINAEAMAALPDLKLICVLATGTNNIDMDEAKRRGIDVRNVTAYGTASVVQHTMMMLLALATRLPLYQHDVAGHAWNQSPIFTLLDHRIFQLQGKHLVIVGQGELGGSVAKIAEAFGMTVTFTARPGNERNDSRPALAEVAPHADVLSLHCPLTPETHHLVDEALLTSMKNDALLINCARGGVIDEAAALEALRTGRLGGLGVDSLPQEPPREGHILIDALAQGGLNLIVTPHNAWATLEARQKVVELTADNIARFLLSNSKTAATGG